MCSKHKRSSRHGTFSPGRTTNLLKTSELWRVPTDKLQASRLRPAGWACGALPRAPPLEGDRPMACPSLADWETRCLKNVSLAHRTPQAAYKELRW